MYYIKWKEAGIGSSIGYFRGFGHGYCWSKLLKEAVSFHSPAEAKRAISSEPRWLDQVEYIFLHPLNFAERVERNG